MTEPNKCPYCGAELHEGASFCFFCMHNLTEKKEIPVKTHRRTGNFRVFAVCAILLMTVGIVLFLYFRDGNADMEKHRADASDADGSAGCVHLYSKATCTSPQTCSLCGDTMGDIDRDGHNWITNEQTIQHDEVGHWEEVENRVLEDRFLCFYCGYDQEGYTSYDELRQHMKVHSNKPDYQYTLSRIESISEIREVWVLVCENVWVVDQASFVETIVSYTCSHCGKDKT